MATCDGALTTIHDMADVSFNASADHETAVVYYEARLYRRNAPEPVATLCLNKPDARNHEFIRLHVGEWLSLQQPGLYSLRVAAVNKDGANESAPSNIFVVPALKRA